MGTFAERLHAFRNHFHSAMSRFCADSCDGGAPSSAVAMLRQLQESKTRRVGKGLSVMYQDGKFVPTKNKKQTEVSEENQLF